LSQCSIFLYAVFSLMPMVTCADCVHAVEITKQVRMRLGQENKEIVNSLERRGFSLDEFCYCEKLGFIESVIMRRECAEWSPDSL
jgi:hypothetical protein